MPEQNDVATTQALQDNAAAPAQDLVNGNSSSQYSAGGSASTIPAPQSVQAPPVQDQPSQGQPQGQPQQGQPQLQAQPAQPQGQPQPHQDRANAFRSLFSMLSGPQLPKYKVNPNTGENEEVPQAPRKGALANSILAGALTGLFAGAQYDKPGEGLKGMGAGYNAVQAQREQRKQQAMAQSEQAFKSKQEMQMHQAQIAEINARQVLSTQQAENMREEVRDKISTRNKSRLEQMNDTDVVDRNGISQAEWEQGIKNKSYDATMMLGPVVGWDDNGEGLHAVIKNPNAMVNISHEQREEYRKRGVKFFQDDSKNPEDAAIQVPYRIVANADAYLDNHEIMDEKLSGLNTRLDKGGVAPTATKGKVATAGTTPSAAASSQDTAEILADTLTKNEGSTYKNNPGALEFRGQPGATPDPKNKRFANFATPEVGRQALLADNAAKLKANPNLTIRQLVAKRTPLGENTQAQIDTQVNNLAKALGISPDTPIKTAGAGTEGAIPTAGAVAQAGASAAGTVSPAAPIASETGGLPAGPTSIDYTKPKVAEGMRRLQRFLHHEDVYGDDLGAALRAMGAGKRDPRTNQLLPNPDAQYVDTLANAFGGWKRLDAVSAQIKNAPALQKAKEMGELRTQESEQKLTAHEQHVLKQYEPLFQAMGDGSLYRLDKVSTMRGGDRPIVAAEMARRFPNWNETEANMKADLFRDAAGGKGKGPNTFAGAQQNANTSLTHMADAHDAMDRLRAKYGTRMTDTAWGHMTLRKANDLFGTDPDWTGLHGAMETATEDWLNLLRNQHAVDQQTEQRAHDIMNPNSTFGNIDQGLQMMAGTAADRIAPLNQTWKQTMGKDHPNLIEPNTLAAIAKINNPHANEVLSRLYTGGQLTGTSDGTGFGQVKVGEYLGMLPQKQNDGSYHVTSNGKTYNFKSYEQARSYSNAAIQQKSDQQTQQVEQMRAQRSHQGIEPAQGYSGSYASAGMPKETSESKKESIVQEPKETKEDTDNE